MDLSDFTLEELLLAAIKSEIESRNIYRGVADQVSNIALKDSLERLALEEDSHREHLLEIYRSFFGEREPRFPTETLVPLPSINFDRKTVKVSDIINQAMEAELRACDFYRSLIKRVGENPVIADMLKRLSEMELQHYELLKELRERAYVDETSEINWDSIHLGP